MDAFTKLSDEELQKKACAGDAQAMELLIVRYKNLVRQNAKALYLIGGDRDDLIQEGMIGLYKAIRDYDSTKNTSFLPFAKLCVSRQIYTAIKSHNTRKNQPLNDYVSFDAVREYENCDGTESSGMKEYLSSAQENPESLVISRENDALFDERVASLLSPFEREVLRAYLEEEKYSRVAKRLGKSMKTVDNALQRIRRKLKKML